MRGEHGHAAGVEMRRDQGDQGVDRIDVERGERLVEDPQRLCLRSRETRQRDAALLPLREIPRRHVLPPGEAEARERRVERLRRRREAGQAQREAQVLARREVLLDGAQMPQVKQLARVLLPHGVRVLPRPQHPARRGACQAAEDAQQAGLAGAVRAGDAQQRARGERELERLE